MSIQRWRLQDLIDLEFFLNQDDGEDLDSLAVRDREIYTRLPNVVTDGNPSASTLLFGWLADRRQSFMETGGETPLPGRLRQELFTLFFWGILVLGLFSGATLAFSFLSYSGSRPVNVSAYFGIFIVFGVLLFLLLIAMTLYRSILGRGLESSFLYRTLRRFFYKVLDKIGSRAASGIGAENRLKWSAHVGGIKQLQKRYGVLFIRPFFLLAQLFGVSFYAGVLAATLLKVVGSDVAFGWQTTLQVGTETIHRLVGWICLPWSWFLPTYCCPSSTQIEGSKLILKDGIYHLATYDLTSWWPFLCLSVLFYCLLPRLALLIVGIVRQRRDLAALRFDHGRYRQLVHRMRTPLVSTRAPEKDQPKKVEEVVAVSETVVEKDVGRDVSVETAMIAALVPDELSDDCSTDQLKELVRLRLGYEVASIQPFWTMERSEEQELAELKERMASDGSEDVLLLQEAWQPPIQELFSFLQQMRETVGEQTTIIIALIGKPAADTILTPVKKLNLQIWQQKMATLGDPGLQLVELVK